jgi:hypothetical protein
MDLLQLQAQVDFDLFVHFHPGTAAAEVNDTE